MTYFLWSNLDTYKYMGAECAARANTISKALVRVLVVSACFIFYIILLLQLNPRFLQLNRSKLQLNSSFLQLNKQILQLNIKIEKYITILTKFWVSLDQKPLFHNLNHEKRSPYEPLISTI
jgi:hypothetical protein